MAWRDRLLCGFLLSFFSAFPVLAQYTTVTGTVTDVNGLAYSNGQMKAQLVLNGGAVTGQPTVTVNNLAQCNAGGFGSAPCQIPFPGTIGPFPLDVNGNIPTGGVQFQNNAQVTPAGTQWFFTINETPGIPPPSGTGPQTCTATITITGATQSITTQLSACPALSKISGGGGGGSPPVGNNGDLQLKNGSVFGASHINDGVTLVNSLLFNEDSAMCGPNPFIDVRCFGARSVATNTAPAIPGVTCSITSGSTTMTVNSAVFVTGDGIDCQGAGPTNTNTTPGAPTVVPSVAASSTGTGYVVPGPTGSTSYCYEIAIERYGQGLTLPSAAGCTSVGQASLGAQSVGISSMSRTNATVSVVTSAAHTLPAGGMVDVAGMTDAVEFGGWYIAATAPDNTHFTFNTGIDSRNGVASTTSTGGTASWFNCNHVTFPIPDPTTVRKYYIYGNVSGGAFSLIDASMPADGSIADEPTYMVWDDFGPTMMNGFVRPSWVPSAPPSAATNDTLVTTVTGGGGTTSLTVANAASNTVSGAIALIDATPNFKAAYNSAKNNGGTVYIPSTPGGANGFIINSYLDIGAILGSPITMQSGQLFLNDTIAINGGQWQGFILQDSAAQNLPSFTIEPRTILTVNSGKPGIRIGTTGGNTFRGVQFQGTGGNNLYNYIFSLTGSPQIFERVTFTGQGGSDLMGVEYYGFTNHGGGFGGLFDQVSFLGGTPSSGTATPYFITKNSGVEWKFHYITGANRGLFFAGPYTNVGGCGAIWDAVEEWQGSSMPVIVLHSNGVGCFWSWLSGVLDTVGEPGVAILSPTAGSISSFNGNLPGSSGKPPLSGQPFTSIVSGAINGAPGVPNFNVGYRPAIGSVVLDGSLNSNVIETHFENFLINSSYSLYSSSGTPVAPVCTTVVAGPPFTPAGTYTWSYAAVFVNGGFGVISGTSNSCTADGTSQQLQIAGTSVLGATSYSWWFQGTNRPVLNTTGCSGAVFPISLSFTYTGSSCGFASTPGGAGGGPAGIHGGTVWGTNAQFNAIQSIGTTNVTGCALTNPIGGSSAGAFNSGTTGTCTVTITPGITAKNGFFCSGKDLTTPADEPKQTAFTTTTCTLSWTTVSGDLITWSATAF